MTASESPAETTKRLEAMRVGGQALAAVRGQLVEFTQEGTTFEQIEAQAQQLIADAGYTPSFSTVPGYDWATCVMKNHQLCHGIPQDDVVESGDVITIDLGLINQGYHLDTTTSFAVGRVSSKIKLFLETGQAALQAAIDQVRPAASVYQLSRAMQKTVEKSGYGAVYQLTGHGIGRELHMQPNIPCVAQSSDKQVQLTEGQTIAVEIMYTLGRPDLVEADDGWTYQTADGSLSAMFEETVLVTADGAEVLTTE